MEGRCTADTAKKLTRQTFKLNSETAKPQIHAVSLHRHDLSLWSALLSTYIMGTSYKAIVKVLFNEIEISHVSRDTDYLDATAPGWWMAWIDSSPRMFLLAESHVR